MNGSTDATQTPSTHHGPETLADTPHSPIPPDASAGAAPTSYARIIDALRAAGRRVIESRDGDAKAQCPAHDDTNPSLHITYDADRGKVLLTCFAGCSPEDVMRALGLDWPDLFDQPLDRHDGERAWTGRREVRTARVASAGRGSVSCTGSSQLSPFPMPSPVVASGQGSLSDAFRDICGRLGVAHGRGLLTAACPVCGRAGALRVLYAPLQHATLLRCGVCGGDEGYVGRLAGADVLAVEPGRLCSNGLVAMAYDDPRGVSYEYADGLSVSRSPDKRIRQHGSTKGRHPLWLASLVAPYAKAGDPVFLVEGEKDAAVLWACGHPATTAPGGEGNVGSVLDPESVRDTLAGARVVAVVDRDATGERWRSQVASMLDGVAASVEWVCAAGMAHDASDAIMCGTGFARLADADAAVPAGEAAHDGAAVTIAVDDDGAGGMRVGEDGGDCPDPEAFWDRAPWLGTVRDAARARLVSPWATLASLLVRVAVWLPPHVVVPPLVGGRPSPLNMLAVVVGPSGTGKGAAEGVAAALWPDLRSAVETSPGSGEGIVTLYTERVEVEGSAGGDGRPTARFVSRCRNPRALLVVPEVHTLGSVMARRGSNIISELTKAWSGESLGGHTKHEDYRVPALAYRFGLVTGVQEGNADILTGPDATATGLPQRFLWAPATDPHPLDYDAWHEASTRPIPSLQRPGADVPDRMADLQDAYRTGALPQDYAWLEVIYPPEVARAVYESRRDKLTDADATLDAHSMLLRLRIAALLPWCDPDRERRLEVTPGDWQTAGLIIEESRRTRDGAIAAQRDAHRSQEADRVRLRRDAARAAADDEGMRDDTARKILTALKDGPQTGRDLCNRRMGQRWRRYVAEALKVLEEAGAIRAADDTQAWSTTTWALADTATE